MVGNKIILTHHFDNTLETFLAPLDRNFVRIFRSEEFKIEDAHQVITEAYIASDKKKYLCIIANSYNTFAQNALLKILEEPPKNIEFILFAKNKNSLLNTIRSRLQIEDRREKVRLEPFELNLEQLKLEDIHNFLKKDFDETQEKLKQKIQSLLFSAHKAGIMFNQQELENFDAALLANSNYQRGNYIFLPLLLMILQKKRNNVYTTNQ
ncbi:MULTISPECIES: DNA polymerase III subunit delta' [unclassified Helicobacter]|uniref:DNA polymerase III subunit delta' n=1 Tax=unclassified Helicobacter TaxID=2593540 RepID=UPI000CF013F7|nr:MULTISPECIES: DNA polymerase III subunit delta' [unclassified Helicobacter]